MFAYMDYLLRDREAVTADLASYERSGELAKKCLGIFLVLSVFYGLVMGSFNLIQMDLADGWKYMLAAAIKLPLMFLATLVICLPLMYVLNVLLGLKATFRETIAVLSGSLAVTSILMSACALILLFFMLCSTSYSFVKILNVAIFVMAGIYGIAFLRNALVELAKTKVPDAEENEETAAKLKNTALTLSKWWLLTFGLVGCQMAWIMRPFIGSPGTPFFFFRPQESNFFIAVAKAFTNLISA